jgi:heme-degrading monooxygenase HmoA
MICRMWHGWTVASNANAYDDYLRRDLFPRVQRELGERGYRGFHVLRLHGESEVEFVTMVWFDSLDSVRSFAGQDYQTAVISAKAHALLCRYDERVQHFELSESSWSEFRQSSDSGKN